MLLIALFASFAIEPAVNWLAQRGWRRGAATGLVFLVIAALAAGFIAVMATLVVNQVQSFVNDAPSYIDDIERFVNDHFDRNWKFDDLKKEFTSKNGSARQFANHLAGKAVQLGVTALGVIFSFFAITLFTFYLVADGPRLRRSICSRLPPERQVTVLRVWELAIDKTGGYLYSRSLLAVLSALAHSIALWVIGVPFPVALGIWVGVVSQFIPTVGTYMAGVLAVGVAALSSPAHGIAALVFVVLYQQVENYLLAPRVTAHTMELHPAVAFGAVIAGAGILGVAGALLALPAAAVIQAIASTIGERHEVTEHALTAEPVRRPRRKRGGGARQSDGEEPG
jgi:predicted PurR-regulated permease PerM